MKILRLRLNDALRSEGVVMLVRWLARRGFQETFRSQYPRDHDRADRSNLPLRTAKQEEALEYRLQRTLQWALLFTLCYCIVAFVSIAKCQ